MADQNTKRSSVEKRTRIGEGDQVDVTYPVDLDGSKATGAKLSANILARLQQLRKRTGIAVSTQIRLFVQKGLDEVENPDVDPKAFTEAITVAGARIVLDDATTASLRRQVELSGQSIPDLIREILTEKFAPRRDSRSGTNQMRIAYLAKAPCGPFREALEESSPFVLSADISETLEAREGDVMVVADGQSMEGVGIPDGAMLMFRQLWEDRKPQRGEVTLVQIEREDGAFESTVKTWVRSEPPTIEDGNGDPVEFPDDTVRVTPVAVGRAVMYRLGIVRQR